MTTMTAWRAIRSRLAVVVLLGAALPAVGPLTEACAAPGTAALVVDLGDEGDVFRYCVELPDTSVSGLELIRLASEQHGLQYRLGYGGRAVCQFQGVGPEGDDCFEDMPYFWGYWRGDGDGGWNWSSTGAGSTSVAAGDVEGWSWGTGQDGSSHPPPPATTHTSVCGAAPPPSEPSGASGDKGEGKSKAAGSEASPAEAPSSALPGDDAGSRNEPKRNKSREAKKRSRTRAPSPVPGPTEPSPTEAKSETRPVAAGEETEGPSPVGLGAVGAALLVLGVGTAMGRKRRSG